MNDLLKVYCGAYCPAEEEGAPLRHRLMAALEAIGVESEEDNLGAETYAVTVPDLDGSWSIVNSFEGMLDEHWGVEFHFREGGAGCSHLIGTTATPIEDVALYVRDELLTPSHTQPCTTGL